MPKTVIRKPPSVEIVLVEPDLAKYWLDDTNIHNRKLRANRMEAYCRDMAADLWLFNGDPIRFDWDGRLIDGQHRLGAIVASGKAQQCVVVHGLDPRAQETVDIGAHRTMSDTLTLRGEANASVVAAIVRRVLLVDHGHRTDTGRTVITHAEISEYIANTPTVARAVEVAYLAKNAGLRAAPSIVGAAYHICARVDEADAEHFFVQQLIENIGLEPGDPARALLRRIQEEARNGRPMHPDDVFRFCMLAWNHYRHDRQITKLQAPKGGWSGKNAPTPK